MCLLSIVALGACDFEQYVDHSEQLPESPNPAATDTLDVDLIDVDGDGDLDLFIVEGTASPAPRANVLFINDGSGTYTDQTAARLPPGAANSTEVDAGDVDGDGDLDLIIANLGANQLLINDGNGVFSDASAAQLPPANPNFLEDISSEALFADLDGDGDLDIIISNENPFNPDPLGGGQNRIWLNDGTGNFSDDTAARLPQLTDQSSGHAIADIDEDGDLDLVVLNLGPNFVLLNDGTGVFSDVTAVSMPGGTDRSSRKGVLADLDDDGCLDLVVANSRGQQNELYESDCSGVFVDASAKLPEDTDTSTDVDVVDADGDGHPDLYFANAGAFLAGHGFLGQQNRLYLNLHGYAFADATHFAFDTESEDPSTNAEFGDVDGDGDIDLVVANSTDDGGAEVLWIRE